MPNNTNRPSKAARKRKVIQMTLINSAILIAASIVTLWAQRTYWPEGILAQFLPYASLLYILMLLPLAISLRARLKEIDKGEEDEASQY